MTTILETERLTLHELSEADAPFMLDQLNQPSFIRHIGDRGVRTLEQAQEYLRDGPLASYATHGFGLYRVDLRESGTPIGSCGLLKRDSLEHPDLGFAFLPAYWSRGYAGESARAVLGHARDTLGLGRVLAIVSPGNGASIKLLERLGFVFERMVRMPGEDADIRLFVLDL